jgi:hypothetical protein
MSIPCGLSQEKVMALASHGVTVVGGRCQNVRTHRKMHICGKPVGAHPPRQRHVRITPTYCLVALSQTLDNYNAYVIVNLKELSLRLDIEYISSNNNSIIIKLNTVGLFLQRYTVYILYYI